MQTHKDLKMNKLIKNENFAKIETDKGAGKLNINKVDSTGTILYKHPLPVSKFIEISFNNAKFSNDFGSGRFFNSSSISKIALSNEQFSHLLLSLHGHSNGNKLAHTSVPCTILFREDYDFKTLYNLKKLYDEKKLETTNIKNKYQNQLNIFKQKLVSLFSNTYSLKNFEVELNQKVSDLENIVSSILGEWNSPKKQKELKILLDDILNYFDKEVDNDTVDSIKEIIANTNDLLLMDKNKNSIKLLSNNSIPNNYNDNEKIKDNNLQIQPFQGILELKEISLSNDDNLCFLDNFESKNGYSLTLYSCENEDSCEFDTIISQVIMSVSQFSSFITSFGEGDGTTVTVTETINNGKIDLCKFCQENLLRNPLTLEVNNFINYIDNEVSTDIEKVSSNINNLFLMPSGKKRNKFTSKREKRNLDIQFQQFYNKIISNVVFYVEQILEKKVQENSNKKIDFFHF